MSNMGNKVGRMSAATRERQAHRADEVYGVGDIAELVAAAKTKNKLTRKAIKLADPAKNKPKVAKKAKTPSTRKRKKKK